MKKGVIYYTDNILPEKIFLTVQKEILKSKLPIISVSLKPIDFGKNFTLVGKPNIVTIIKQIILALEKSDADNVFFCEHDVLYPLSHFDFIPEKKNIFYYNDNVWRWRYPDNYLIRYDRLISLSGLCANRIFALNHFKARLEKIKEMGFDKDTKRHEPDWARKWGYEPGTKKQRRGGFSDDDFETWSSPVAMIDIRHGRNFSPPKVSLAGFKHAPKNWQENTLDKIPGWNFDKLFN